MTASAAPTVYISQDFTHSATVPNAWTYGGTACLTAGYSATPSTSVPACGSLAPLDKGGSGTLELSPSTNNWQLGYIISNTIIPTSAGVMITFDYYSYGTKVGDVGDGAAVILADQSIRAPALGGCCASFGYAPWNNGQVFQAGLSNGWAAIGLDEDGWWTCTCNGKTGGTPQPTLFNTITVRGSAQTSWNYLTGATNAKGVASPLPFSLTAGYSQVRPTPLTFYISISATGVLTVAVDRHNGAGPVVYLKPTELVGLYGEPAVPANFNVGFSGGGGNANARHEIANVTISSL